MGTIVYSPMHNGMLTESHDVHVRVEALDPDSDWRKQVNPAFEEPLLYHLSRFRELFRGVARFATAVQ